MMIRFNFYQVYVRRCKACCVTNDCSGLRIREEKLLLRTSCFQLRAIVKYWHAKDERLLQDKLT